MPLTEKLMQDLKRSLKSGDKVRTNVIRMLLAQFKDARIAKRADLSEQDEIGVLLNAAKKRKEAMEAFEKGGRQDRVQQEKQELAIINEYLPKALSDAEVETIIEAVIQRVGATSLKDIGKVMPEAMKELKGKADGKVVQEIVRRKLG